MSFVTSIVLSQELNDKIKAASKRLDVSKSEFIRDAISAYIEDIEAIKHE
jgi:predicted DNA-binding protein